MLNAYGGGILNETYNDANNPANLIPQVRLAEYSSLTEEGFEIWVTNGVVGRTINFHVSGLDRPPLGANQMCSGPALSTQSVNSSASVVMNIGPGISTSGSISSSGFYADGVQLTDASGHVSDSALNIVDPVHGGLGVNASSWPAGVLPYTTGTGTFGNTPITSFGCSLIGGANASAAQSLLGLTLGGTVQPYSASLSSLAGLSQSGGNLIVGNGSGWTTTSTLPLTQLPASVLQNNESGVTLTGTFSGNGGGLWGLAFTNVLPMTSVGAGGNMYLVYTNPDNQNINVGFSSSPNIPGCWNTILGYDALWQATTNCGSDTAVGYESMYWLTNGGGAIRRAALTA